jgi:predicted  nucleic acid-binding Zn-ribbon protein
MKKMILVAVVAATFLAFQGCSPTTERKVDDAAESMKRDIQKEKEDITNELRAVRDDIDDRLDRISLELETAKDNSAKQLDATKENLIEQREKVERALDGIDKSANDTWDDVRSRTRETTKEVKGDFERLAASVDSVLVN